MELKNAVVTCLIALFSATLVLLIARALDLRAASQLEPHLARIAEELQAIRKGGGITAASGGMTTEGSSDDGVIVYYFHGNIRCPTCRSIESQSHEAVQGDFASQLDRGEIVWKVLNYEEPAVAELAELFEIQMPIVVLVRMEDGRIGDWKRLDGVWALVGDKPAFAEYVQAEIRAMLGTAPLAAPTAPEAPAPEAMSTPDPPILEPIPTDDDAPPPFSVPMRPAIPEIQ